MCGISLVQQEESLVYQTHDMCKPCVMLLLLLLLCMG